MSIKGLVLNKGWAGTTLNRSETAERLNLLIRPLIELMYQYDAVLMSDTSEKANIELGATLPNLRADIGKLSETILSCGDVAYAGTDLDPAAFGDTDWIRIRDAEEALLALLAAAAEVEHQIRTRAILDAVASNSKNRLERLSRKD